MRKPPKLPMVPDAGTTSTSLLRLVQQQDEDAWRRLETIYRPLVFYWCDAKAVHVNNWEDIAQAVFMTLHKYIGEFTKYRGKISFRPWLRRVTASRIADFKETNKNAHALFSETSLELIRHLLVTKIREEEPTDEAVERQIVIRQVMEDIKTRVNKNTWEAFQQTAIGGLDSFAVAEMLDMKPDSVRKAKANVLRMLREELNDLLD